MLTTLFRTDKAAPPSQRPRLGVSFKLAFLLLAGLLVAKVSLGQTITYGAGVPAAPRLYLTTDNTVPSQPMNIQFFASVAVALTVTTDNSPNFFVSATPNGTYAATATVTPGTTAATATNFYVRRRAGAATSMVVGATGNFNVQIFNGITPLTPRLINWKVYDPAPIAFTPGNLVLMQLSEGTSTTTASAVPAILVEVPPTGGTGILHPIPFQAGMSGTGNRPLTILASSASSGFLNTSPGGGKFLTFAGTAAPFNQSTTAAPSPYTDMTQFTKTIGVVDFTGAINTRTAITNAYGGSGSNVRSAVTVDGSAFWTSGTGSLAVGAVTATTVPLNGSIYVPANDNGSGALQVNSNTVNHRGNSIFNGQLFVTSASAGFAGPNRVGIGLPTTGGNTAAPAAVAANTITNLTAGALTTFGSYGVSFVADPANPGSANVYLALDQAGNVTTGTAVTAGILKYYWNGTTLLYKSQLVTTATSTGVYAVAKTGGACDVYFTTSASAFRITDNSGFNGTPASVAFDAAATAVSATSANGFLCLYTVLAANGRLNGISLAPQAVAPPIVSHSANTSFTAPSMAQGVANNVLYSIQAVVDGAGGPATLTGLTLTSTGNYLAGDVTNFKVYGSTSSSNLTQSLIGSFTSAGAAGEVINFGTLSYVATEGTTVFYTVTADLGCSNIGRTVGIAALNTALSAVTYSDPLASKSGGTLAAGTNYAIVAGSAIQATALAVVNNGSTLTTSWTNPACYDEILVVASTSASFFSAPVDPTVYTGNLTFGLGTALGAGPTIGYVVSKTTGNLSGNQSIIVSGLTTGTPYFFYVFTKKGASYSAAVIVNGTPTITTFYSCSGGTITSASTGSSTWSLSPGCAPLTLVTPTWSRSVNMVVQNGHDVTLNVVSINVFNATINVGGSFSSGAGGLSRFLAVYGPTFQNDGVVGGDGQGTLDPTRQLGINLYNPITTFTGGGSTNLGALTTFNLSPVSVTAIIASNISFTRTDAGSIFANNNTAGGALNVVINPGVTVTSSVANGNLSLDGPVGTGGTQATGTVTVNGTLIGLNTLYARNNNTVGNTTNYIVNSGGNLLANDVTADLTAGAGSALTVNAGGYLGVGTVLRPVSGTNVGNNFTLRNRSNRSAVIDVVPGGVTLGTVTAEIAIPSSTYHLLGSPIQGRSYSNWLNLAARILPENNASVFYYNEADSSSRVINGGRIESNGYRVPAVGLGLTTWPGFGGSPLGLSTPSGFGFAGYTFTGVSTLRLVGTPTSGAVSVPLQATPVGASNPLPANTVGFGGWNLIANPYQAVIDWDLAIAANGGYATNPTEGTVYRLRSDNTFNVYKNGTPTAAGRFILPGQGFFVEYASPTGVSTNTATFNFAEANKTITTLGTFFRAAATENMLSMTLVGNKSSTEAIFGYRDGATLEYDRVHDAYVFPGASLELATATPTDRKLVFNFIGTPTDATVTPLVTKVYTTGTFKLVFAGQESFDVSQVLYLRDKFLGTISNLASLTEYAFTVTDNPASINNRFELVAGPASVTSVAKAIKGAVLVYPNPAQGAFTVSASGLKGASASINVLAADGRTVYTTTAPVTEGIASAPVATRLPAGVYMVRVVSSGVVSTTKLIVQ